MLSPAAYMGLFIIGVCVCNNLLRMYSVNTERAKYFQQMNQLANLMNDGVTEKCIWHNLYICNALNIQMCSCCFLISQFK